MKSGDVCTPWYAMHEHGPDMARRGGMMNVTADEEYLTVLQAARRLAVSPSTVWRWIAAGKLHAYRIGDRTIRITDADIATALKPAASAAPRTPSPPVSQFQIPRPTPQELARRHAAVAETLDALKRAPSIAPLTTSDLIRMARKEEETSYDPGDPR
ncbi:MAG: excisionase family DNA-binding protein [Dehalococcoidia bacterium]